MTTLMEAAMMGEKSGSQDQLFYQFNLDEQVPADHLLRKIDAVLDLSFSCEICIAPNSASEPRPA